MSEKRSPLRVYPPPLHTRLVKAYAEYTGQSESSVISDAIKEKFEKMPSTERDRILNFTKK